MRCLNINDAQVVAALGHLGVSVEPRKAVRFRNWHKTVMPVLPPYFCHAANNGRSPVRVRPAY